MIVKSLNTFSFDPPDPPLAPTLPVSRGGKHGLVLGNELIHLMDVIALVPGANYRIVISEQPAW